MGHIGNIIIKKFQRQMCVPLENSAYFGDEDGFNSNPDINGVIVVRLYQNEAIRKEP